MRQKWLTILLLIAIVALYSCDSLVIPREASAIKDTLKKSCDCKEIEMVSFISGKWAKYGTYKLVDCKFPTTEVEGERLKKILSDKVPDFCKLNFVILDFVNQGVHDTITVKCSIK